MNFIERMVLRKMIKKLSDAMQGHRTKATAGLGILIALAGSIWGPLTIGSLEIPKFSPNEFFDVLWMAALAIFIHDKKGV